MHSRSQGSQPSVRHFRLLSHETPRREVRACFWPRDWCGAQVWVTSPRSAQGPRVLAPLTVLGADFSFLGTSQGYRAWRKVVRSGSGRRCILCFSQRTRSCLAGLHLTARISLALPKLSSLHIKAISTSHMVAEMTSVAEMCTSRWWFFNSSTAFSLKLGGDDPNTSLQPLPHSYRLFRKIQPFVSRPPALLRGRKTVPRLLDCNAPSSSRCRPDART
jgi:hypothetical protein